MNKRFVDVVSCLFRRGEPPSSTAPIIAKLILNELAPRLAAEDTSFEDAEYYHYGMQSLLCEISTCIVYKALEYRHAKTIIADCFSKYVGYGLLQYLVESKLLDNEVSSDQLDELADEALAANPKAVAELKGGKDKAIGAIVGYAMKKQKCDPVALKELVLKKLGL